MPIPDGWPLAVYEAYEPIRIIGRGGFASVWMARDRRTGGGGGEEHGGGDGNGDDGGGGCDGDVDDDGGVVEAAVAEEVEDEEDEDGDDRRRRRLRPRRVRRGRPTNRLDGYVAIKIMKNDAHAGREVSILSELSSLDRPHPNIVRLLRSTFEDESIEIDEDEDANVNANDNDDARRRRRGRHHHRGGLPPPTRAVVLSLAYGPTLYRILADNGALGMIMSRVISRQLIRAVAFLHGHAVIHRDVQPCNVIVSGGTTTDDLWYSDEYDVDGRVMRMARGCRITLIDFGFARALGPRDMIDDDDKAAHHAATPAGEIADGPCFADRALEDVAAPGSRRGRSNAFNARREVGTTVDQYNDDSISRRRVLDISAVGTRSYAAPEILSGIRSLVVDNLNSSSLRRSNNNKGRSFDDRFTPAPNPTKTLGSCVSNYGMVADAFSVGATIRHMVTGVPPNVDVGDFMAWRDHPLMRLSRSLGRCIRRKDKRRRKKYRSCADLPLDARNLIHNLTHYDPSRRATVRSVTRHPWIETGAEADAYPESGPGGPIAYLKCAEN